MKHCKVDFSEFQGPWGSYQTGLFGKLLGAPINRPLTTRFLTRHTFNTFE